MVHKRVDFTWYWMPDKHKICNALDNQPQIGCQKQDVRHNKKLKILSTSKIIMSIRQCNRSQFIQIKSINYLHSKIIFGQYITTSIF